MAAGGQNIEHLTIVQCTEKLCNTISSDPLKVCHKLFQEHLVAKAQVSECQSQSKDNYSKAGILLEVVTRKIEAYPDKFEPFLKILNEFEWSQDEVNDVRRKYEDNKAKLATQEHQKYDDDTLTKIAEENKTKLELNHATLVTEVAKRLEQLKIDFQSLHLYTTTCFSEVKCTLAKADSIKNIFKALSGLTKWKCDSISALEDICKKFGNCDRELMKMIHDYKSELAGFRATTKIVHFMRCMNLDDINAGEEEIEPDAPNKSYKKLSAKLRAVVTEKCLDYIHQLWASLAEYLYLPELPVLLKSIQNGCIEVTWLIPMPTYQDLQAKVEKSAEVAQHLNIVTMKLDHKIVYCEERGQRRSSGDKATFHGDSTIQNNRDDSDSNRLELLLHSSASDSMLRTIKSSRRKIRKSKSDELPSSTNPYVDFGRPSEDGHFKLPLIQQPQARNQPSINWLRHQSGRIRTPHPDGHGGEEPDPPFRTTNQRSNSTPGSDVEDYQQTLLNRGGSKQQGLGVIAFPMASSQDGDSTNSNRKVFDGQRQPISASDFKLRASGSSKRKIPKSKSGELPRSSNPYVELKRRANDGEAHIKLPLLPQRRSQPSSTTWSGQFRPQSGGIRTTHPDGYGREDSDFRSRITAQRSKSTPGHGHQWEDSESHTIGKRTKSFSELLLHRPKLPSRRQHASLSAHPIHPLTSSTNRNKIGALSALIYSGNDGDSISSEDSAVESSTSTQEIEDPSYRELLEEVEDQELLRYSNFMYANTAMMARENSEKVRLYHMEVIHKCRGEYKCLQKEHETLKTQMRQEKSRGDTFQSQLSSQTRENRTTLKSQMVELTDLRSEYDTKKKEVEELKQLLDAKEKELQSVRGKLADQNAKLSQLVPPASPRSEHEAQMMETFGETQAYLNFIKKLMPDEKSIQDEIGQLKIELSRQKRKSKGRPSTTGMIVANTQHKRHQSLPEFQHDSSQH